MNTFTGPIVVEGGSLRLGRPLAEGQTVLVKSGAKFYPACAADLAKITYEDSSDAPDDAVFHVEANYADGLDLLALAPAYLTDKLGGPSGSWNGEVPIPLASWALATRSRSTARGSTTFR